jgi:hypothetical protein
MRRRTILLIGGVAIILLGAGLYSLGLYWNTGSVAGGANIGAGIAAIFGEIFGVLGLGVLVVWAIAALVVRLRNRSSIRG